MALFEACFTDWALPLRSDAPDLIALDGKSLRRSGDGPAGRKPLHLVSAWASTQRLVLAQEPVDAKENECAAMLAILDRLDLKGALVTVDAIATNPAMAEAITRRGGDYPLALKRNQMTLHCEVEAFFADPDASDIETVQTLDKDHGRLETRLRRGHGARNMALVRRFAFNIVRVGRGNTSIKTARQAAGWDTSCLASLLSCPRQPGLVAVGPGCDNRSGAADAGPSLPASLRRPEMRT